MLILLVVGFFISVIHAELCSRPVVYSRSVYIYRLRDSDSVTIYNCLHKHGNTIYSDITDNCLVALKTKKFADKFNHTSNIVKDPSKKGYVINYSAHTDRIENIVNLKSGTICRYDRGFCYDQKEHLYYAAVWDIDSSSKEIHGDLIFQGSADIWNFKNNTLRYLFLESPKKNEAFSLQLLKIGKIGKVSFWYTEKMFIVSHEPLWPVKLTQANGTELGVKSKALVSEEILKNCDIQSLEISKSVRPLPKEYFMDPDNLKTILLTYGRTLSYINETDTQIQQNQIEMEKWIINLKNIVKQNDNTIEDLKINISLLNNNLLNYTEIFEKFQNNMNDFEPKSLHDLKNKLTNDNVQLRTELEKLIGNIPEQLKTNTDIARKLKLLDDMLLDHDTRISSIYSILSELEFRANQTTVQKQESDSTKQALQELKLSLEIEIKKISEKHNTLSKSISENKKINTDLQQELVSLNRSIFDTNSDKSVYGLLTAFKTKVLNDIKELQEALKKLQIKYSQELPEQMQAEHEELVMKYNLMMTRVYDSEKLIAILEKQLKELTKTIANISEDKSQYNNSLSNLESRITHKFIALQNNCSNEFKFIVSKYNTAISEITQDVDQNYKEVMQSIESMKKLIKTGELNNGNKNISLSISQNSQKIDNISSKINELKDMENSVNLHSLKIKDLFIAVDSEKQYIHSLNVKINVLTNNNKIFSQKFSEIDAIQSKTRNTLNSYDKELKNIKSQVNLALQNGNTNKKVPVPSNQCNECTIRKFKELEERITVLNNNIVEKDKDLTKCQSEIKVNLRTHDEEIAAIKEDVRRLRNEILQSYIEPN